MQVFVFTLCVFLIVVLVLFGCNFVWIDQFGEQIDWFLGLWLDTLFLNLSQDALFVFCQSLRKFRQRRLDFLLDDTGFVAFQFESIKFTVIVVDAAVIEELPSLVIVLHTFRPFFLEFTYSG